MGGPSGGGGGFKKPTPSKRPLGGGGIGSGQFSRPKMGGGFAPKKPIGGGFGKPKVAAAVVI